MEFYPASIGNSEGMMAQAQEQAARAATMERPLSAEGSEHNLSIRHSSLDMAIQAFCPKLISAEHVVKAAETFEAYLRGPERKDATVALQGVGVSADAGTMG